MYKVLIADDEPLEREALARILNDPGHDIQVVGEAADGNQAVKQVEELSPDIIFMDIRMPGLDGITATRIIKGRRPELRVVVLSAYDEFSYAQEALKDGVTDYLLKPASSKELLAALDKAVREIEDGLRNQKALETISQALPFLEIGLVHDLISGEPLNPRSLNVRLSMLGTPVAPSVAIALHVHGGQEVDNQLSEAVKAVRREDVRRLVGQGTVHALTAPVRSSELAMLLCSDELAPCSEAREISLGWATGLQQQLLKETSILTTIGIGRHYSEPAELSRSYREARDALVHSLFLGHGGVIHIDDISRPESTASLGLRDEAELLRCIQVGDTDAAKRTFLGVMERLLQTPGDIATTARVYALESTLTLLRAARQWGVPSCEFDGFPLTLQLERVSHPEELLVWADSAVTQLMAAVNKNREYRQSHLAAHAAAFVREHYAENLNLESVSNAIYVSPFYLSHLFHKEMGCTFSEYVSSVRMENAKQLLRHSRATLGQIAETVGYSDPNYFSKVFKRVEGISPQEYRNRVQSARRPAVET